MTLLHAGAGQLATRCGSPARRGGIAAAAAPAAAGAVRWAATTRCRLDHPVAVDDGSRVRGRRQTHHARLGRSRSPLEAVRRISSRPRARRGQSYVSPDGATWDGPDDARRARRTPTSASRPSSTRGRRRRQPAPRRVTVRSGAVAPARDTAQDALRTAATPPSPAPAPSSRSRSVTAAGSVHGAARGVPAVAGRRAGRVELPRRLAARQVHWSAAAPTTWPAGARPGHRGDHRRAELRRPGARRGADAPAGAPARATAPPPRAAACSGAGRSGAQSARMSRPRRRRRAGRSALLRAASACAGQAVRRALRGPACSSTTCCTSEAFAAAAPRLRRGAGVYAPSFFAPYVLARRSAPPAARLAGRGARRRGRHQAGRRPRAVSRTSEVPVLPARGVLYGADVAPAPHVVGERQQALAALAAGGVVVAEAVALLERFLPLELQPRPLALAPGDEISFDAVVARLAAPRLRARRAGARPRRVRRARRPHRRLPGPRRPAARRVLGRRGREPAHLLRLLAAHHGDRWPAATVYAAFEADTSLPEYETGLHQAIAAWEREGSEEAPDELVPARRRPRPGGARRARFTTLGDVAAAGGCALRRVQPRRDVPRPGRLRRRGGDGGDGARACASGSTCRSPRPAPSSPARCSSTSCSATSRCSSMRRGRSSPRATSSGAERDLLRLVRDGYRVFVVFRHEGEAERATYRLRNLSAEVVTPRAAGPRRRGRPRASTSSPRPCARASSSADLKLAVVNERALLRARAARAALRRRHAPHDASSTCAPATTWCTRTTASPASAGIETRTVAGITRDYLLLQFRGEDRVFVPHDQIGKVSRYIGASGGDAGARQAGRHALADGQDARPHGRRRDGGRAAAALRRAPGDRPASRYPPDGELMRRLEDAFPFEETEDQAEAIDEVKNDMEAPHPMDRLICGDVGYGKTEVALRAAFKAAEAGKQTLVLVPTTILAEQHSMTFSERYADLPVRVGMVSRFRTGAEQRRILAEFSAGKLDVLVGTHRLLSTDVQPQGSGPRGRRRGAAIRRAPEGAAAQPQAAGGRDEPLGDAHPAHPADVAHAASATSRSSRRRRAAATRSAPTSASTATTWCASPSRRSWPASGQAFYLHNRVETIDAGRRARARAGAAGAPARGPRPDARARAREGDAGVPRRRGRRAGHDVDHRERHRHPQRQHAGRGARRHARPGAALPDPRAHRPQRRARLRLPAVPERGAADRATRRRG